MHPTRKKNHGRGGQHRIACDRCEKVRLLNSRHIISFVANSRELDAAELYHRQATCRVLLEVLVPAAAVERIQWKVLLGLLKLWDGVCDFPEVARPACRKFGAFLGNELREGGSIW